MALIERLAIIGIGAQPHLIAATQSHLAEPVRIGKRLACEADDVGMSCREQRFGLRKVVNAARDHDRHLQIPGVQAGAHVRGRRKIASEWTLGI